MAKKIKEDRGEKESFLWHEVSGEEREEIKKQAKRIMDDFGKALEKVGGEGFVFVERENFFREEGEGKISDSDFKSIMFENAPKKNKHSLLGEKATWV